MQTGRSAMFVPGRPARPRPSPSGRRCRRGGERFRPEFKAAQDAYHYEEHLSLRAGHKEIVSEEFVRSVTISGDREQCLARLLELATVDIDRISFALLSGGRLRRLEELGRHVLPRLKAN